MWDEQDDKNGLREKLAKVIASKISGLPFEEVCPEQHDFDLADSLADVIDRSTR